jgi:hypothetical protein
LAGLASSARDVVAEAAQPRIDLAQPVEEEQAGLHDWMRELALDEFERGPRAGLQQQASLGALLQRRAAPVGMPQRHRAR